MNKEDIDAIEKVLTNFGLDDSEKKLINLSNALNTAICNYTNVISIFLVAKQLMKSTDDMIKSNKEHSKVVKEHSNRMYWLTWALVIATVFQAVGIFLNHKAISLTTII